MINVLHRFRPNFVLGSTRLTLSRLWVGLPVVLWAMGMYILPLAAPVLTPTTTWLAATFATLIIVLSAALHSAGHVFVARWCRAAMPERIVLEPYGDAAQIWPLADNPLRELLIAMAGPVASGIQAMVWAIVWNLQIHPALNAIAFIAVMLNGVLAVINLMPGMPLDGGRMLRGLLWADMGLASHDLVTRSVGIALCLGLMGWGAFLLSLQSRFSLETGLATIAVAVVLLVGLRHRAAVWPAPPAVGQRLVGGLTVGIVFCVLFLVAVGPLPLLDGLYSPGPAVSVEPMVRVPDQRRTRSNGEFLLTTVIAQTPITLAQWAYARVDPAFVLVAPEQIVPADSTPQQVMQNNVAMLEESEALATVVGVRLAGYQADLVSTALQVVSVLPESPSSGLVQPGDLILQVNGVATPRLDLLRTELARYQAGEQVTLELERNSQVVTVQVMLMAPVESGAPPRIGVGLQPVGLDVVLPFPVAIEEQKIAGGPSAGLMFTLSVYDALAPEDLTHGWRIAGTGTITLDGRVGPIGGIEQKVAGAEWAGATYFLVPRDHEAAARRVARRIQIIPVGTVEEAIAALRRLPERP